MEFIHNIRYIYVVACVTLASACSTAPTVPTFQQLLNDDYSLVRDYLQAYIPGEMKKHNITGLSVALIDNQKIVWSDGFGFADKSANALATVDTLYQAGSVSKVFTAMGVMKLVEEGKLSLDAPIKAAVPEFSLKSRFGSTDGINLRNMLSHHSGIPGNIVDGMWVASPTSYKEVTTQLKHHHAAYPPNTVFAYSNAAYSVAGHAIENASGVPFVKFIQDKLLDLLEMNQSNFNFDNSGPFVAKSYWNGEQIQALNLRDIPAGGLVTNVNELSNLVKLVNAEGYYKVQILKPETLKEMLAVQQYDSAYEIDSVNGIGWYYTSGYLDNKYNAVGHGGQALAHSASVVIIPELKLGVVILANSPNLTDGIALITDKILRLAHSVKTKTELTSLPDTKRLPPPGVASDFEGQYASTDGIMEFTKKSNGYQMTNGGEKFSLIKNGQGHYKLRYKWLGLIPISIPELENISFFARVVDGKKLIIADAEGQRSVVGTPLLKQTADPVWDTRIGDYEQVNPVASDSPIVKLNKVTLNYERGVYHLTFKNPEGFRQLPLQIINDYEASLQGFGRDLGETIVMHANGSMSLYGLQLMKTN